MLCQLVFQPVIRLIQIVVSIVEYVLTQICELVSQLVNVVTQVLAWICNTVVQTVCGAVCSVICGICDFFCGIFGCDCGCDKVCKNVCNVVTNVVCGWTYVLQTVLQWVTTLICNYILQAIVAILNVVEAVVTMILTWVCSLVDVVIRWLLCWLYIAEIFNNTDPRRFRVAPKIIRNDRGYSDWFVYVNNSNADGAVDQVQLYILSDQGRPLLPVVDHDSGEVGYFEVEVRDDHITGQLRQVEGAYVAGQPLLYYPYKVIEIASHLLGDIFASQANDNGRGSDYHKNLFTYDPNVQDALASDGKLAGNNYNAWSGKYTDPSSTNYFGDGSITDVGMRVDTDSTCSHPTNSFLHLVNGRIEFTPCSTAIAETMSCGPGQTLTFDQTNFLMLNKNTDSSTVTTYFVSKYNDNDTSVGCNDLLGYTIVTYEGSDKPLFVDRKVLVYDHDASRMMAKIVENVAPGNNPTITRVAETYLHECGHQCGLLHDSDKPDCENDKTLRISKLMNPGGSIRRAYTRIQWCMVRTSPYMTSRSIEPFTQAPELLSAASEDRIGSTPPGTMSHSLVRRELVTVVAANARQREVHRQIAFNRMRKGVMAGKDLVASQVPALFSEFVTSLVAALLGAWIISLLLTAVVGVAPIYTLAVLGLMYSAQATYHKYRLKTDPTYKVPRCHCTGRRHDNSETVLQDRASSIVGIPNSVFSAAGYLTVLALLVSNHSEAVVPLAVAAALMSGYLSYVMLFRIRALCSTCVNLCALNFLVLVTVAL